MMDIIWIFCLQGPPYNPMSYKGIDSIEATEYDKINKGILFIGGKQIQKDI